MKSTDELDEYIKNHCFSCYEGCACTQLKNHEGLHTCMDNCGETWTDEDEARWMKELGVTRDG